MKSINVTLPTELPSVQVGEEQYNSYQNISTNEDDNNNDNDTILHTPKSFISRLRRPYIIAAVGLTLAFVLLLTARKGVPVRNKDILKSIGKDFMGGEEIQATFCKTSCTSQCSSYSSVYGPLCCDWSEGNDGTKFCAQSISKEGACECGVSSTGTSPSGPGGPNKPQPSGTPARKPAPAPHDDGGFHPFPTMAWMPFDDDQGKKGGGGGGFEPFKPFKPIKVPKNSTPCKEVCDNPCGQSDGRCCDYTPKGNCDMTTIDGKCYCGGD
mmetsp:Transcript_7770/g.7842  ORF Transcript_7770/g.7842 Transcript_7770/m.7842 type:complete len:268 (-) Transcript_7770:214-1017(-)